MNKIPLLFLSLFLFAFFLNGDVYTALSAPAPLEIDYPDIFPIAPPPISREAPIFIYARYFLVFLIASAGIIALFVLTSAGFQYISSSGNQQGISEAKDKIRYALLGLLIVMGYFIALNTLNPDLINSFGLMPKLETFLKQMTPGVYFCTQRIDIPGAYKIQQENNVSKKDENNAIMEQIKNLCRQINSSSSSLGEIDNNATWVYLVPYYVPSYTQQYGVIVYEESEFKGRAAMFFSLYDENKVQEWGFSSGLKPSSAIPFILNFQPSASTYITIYQLINYNRQNERLEPQKITPNYFGGKPSLGLSINLPPPEKAQSNWPEIASLKIEPANRYIVVFFRDYPSSWTDASEIDVYIASDSDLYGNKMGREGEWRDDCKKEILVTEEVNPGAGTPGEEKRMVQYPCAAYMVIVSASTF